MNSSLDVLLYIHPDQEENAQRVLSALQKVDDIQIHMSHVIQGDFSQEKINTKDNIYLEELVKTYNYLYSALQSNLKRDLTFLKELESAHDPELAKILINEKVEQLKFQTLQKARDSVRDSREASPLKIAN